MSGLVKGFSLLNTILAFLPTTNERVVDKYMKARLEMQERMAKRKAESEKTATNLSDTSNKLSEDTSI